MRKLPPEERKRRKAACIKRWRAANSAKVRSYVKRWREANKNKIKVYNKKWTATNFEYVRKDRKLKYAKRLRALNLLKNTPCLDCKGRFPPECMDFDHVRGRKITQVSHMKNRRFKDMLAEIAKCDLVCSNCHRIRTKKRIQIK